MVPELEALAVFSGITNVSTALHPNFLWWHQIKDKVKFDPSDSKERSLDKQF